MYNLKKKKNRGAIAPKVQVSLRLQCKYTY